MSSYDELLKQVESLRRENSHLQQELRDNSSQLCKLEVEGSSLKEALNQTQDGEAEYSFNDDDLDCREHLAVFDDGNEVNDSQTLLDPGIHDNGQGQGHSRSPDSDQVDPDSLRQNEEELLSCMHQYDKERTNLVQQIEAEEKNRKWYYDQIEMATRKIRSLPLNDPHSNPAAAGLTRKHLEFEISRLRETMHASFGTNEMIEQRREARVQRIRQIEAELIVLQQQHREQAQKRSESQSQKSHHNINQDDMDSVAMAMQADQNGLDGTDSRNPNIPAMYHGTWPIETDDSTQSSPNHQDLASVMSFNSTNTSSSQGSRGQRSQQQQQTQQPVPQPLAAQQLGTKVEMVYGLLSMLGTHDKDDMSRTLLAMSSSQDSCIAMRQSGCLPLLIQLLHGSDKDSALLGNTRGSKAARARAAAALHNIVHSHPDDKRGRREARVLRLLEQIRAHCDQLREMMSSEEEVPASAQMDHHPGYAIAALMKLSFDEEHRHAICTLGGLHAIAELLQVDHEVNSDTNKQYNVTMRRYACMALTNLTFGDGTNKASLCSMKPAMRALVSQLFSSNEELCQVAASVLRNLSWKADLASKKTLREVGAVTSLMEAAMRVTKETTLKSILSALWNLSAHCSENKADICAVDGALIFLIASLTYKSPSKTTAIIENGGGILRNVSSHIAVREDYRQTLRQHGCMQILLKHLRSPSLTIVSNACGTLWNLSARCAEDQQALWEMGAVNMLRNLVNSKHKMISMGSSAALKNLLAARPAMKNLELNKQGNMNRPTLHVRKQRALESEIDQNLSETCENVESPRDSPVESKKTENGHFVYPVYQLQDNDTRRSLLRGQVMPRSQSGGDNTMSLENQINNQQRVSRSGSQDSVGSTHSDISHDRSRTNLATRSQVNMGGSLDRNKETLTPGKRYNSDGRCERNPLGPPNSRILQVMQEVALHAGIEGQSSHSNDSAVFKTPLPVSHSRVHPPSHQPVQSQMQDVANPTLTNAQKTAMYQMLVMQNGKQFSNGTSNQYSNSMQEHNHGNQNQTGEDEKPLDYSLKYRENNVHSEANGRTNQSQNGPQQPMVDNYIGNAKKVPNLRSNQFNQNKNVFFDRQVINNRYQYNSAYAETDLDAQDQLTDFSARYGAEYQNQYTGQGMSYGNNYDESDPNCADCKLEEARRYNDRLEQTYEHDQVTTFCTEDTPYLSTATSLTDLSTAAKILEEAQEQFSSTERDYAGGDEVQNFGTKFAEKEERSAHMHTSSEMKQQQYTAQSHKSETDHSSRSGSQATDPCTGTTVIANYNLNKLEHVRTESQTSSVDDHQERSFHNTCSEDAPADQTKTYCEEGTPTCFSRVSSLSSLHSSDANDRQDKKLNGPLQRIEEKDDPNSSLVKMQSSGYNQHSSQKNEGLESREGNENPEKEHKTVTFDDKEHIQETPMMFSRCTSLGSLSSFDTQSVHSSVFSEYSRRASENVSPSELPDSPSESMPSSPGRVKSPERFQDKKSTARQELFPEPVPPQFTDKAVTNAKRVHPLTAFVAMGTNLQLGSSNRQFDIETSSSCKSEAPVVYADEGTPPTFQDNLSTLSEITTDRYEINDKTLVEHDKSGIEEIPTNYSLGDNVSIPHRQDEYKPSVNMMNIQPTVRSEQPRMDTTGHVKYQEQSQINHSAEMNATKPPDKNIVEKGEPSDDSEGDDDLLADIMSSAMPDSKKMKKSSSDNAIKRKSSSSSKADSGSSSRSKTPAKTPIDSPASKSGQLRQGSRSNSTSGSHGKTPKKEDMMMNRGNVAGVGAKQKSMLPKPAAHPGIARLQKDESSSLNSSIDSSRSETPFNVSNTLSVIDRSSEKFTSHAGAGRDNKCSSSASILQKAESLPVYDEDDDEGIKTYATEDTPFSGSIPASPRNDRKFPGGQPPADLNQDSLKTFATEGTPFSGSMPGSPKQKRAANYSYIDTEPDTVKCYNTEDTPFTGSAPESPKLNRKQGTKMPNVTTTNPTHQINQNFSHNKGNTFQRSNVQSFNHPLPSIDTSADTLRSYAVEGTPYNQSNLPSPKPATQKNQPKFNPSMLGNIDCIRNGFEASEDQIKTFATEGTPLNYSRTGSFSDLSSLNTNFEEKVKIDAKPEVADNSKANDNLDDTNSDNSSIMEENEELLSEIMQSAMPAAKSGKPSRRSLDRKAEGAEGKDKISFDGSSRKVNNNTSATYIPGKFQPQRTSSLAHQANIGHALRLQSEIDMDEDQVRTFAVEDTPNNASVKTSLSDLTVDTDIQGNTGGQGRQFSSQSMSADLSLPNNSSNYTNTSLTATYGTSNDSVFIQSELGASNSMMVFKTEGTPQTFSCNDSLSTLSMLTDDDSKDEVSKHIKMIALQLSKDNTKTTTDGMNQNDNNISIAPPVKVKEDYTRSDSRSSASGNSSQSVQSVRELERHVIGQSSEDQSVHEEEIGTKRSSADEMKKFGVEDTPLCFSRNSSLSSINGAPENFSMKEAVKHEEKVDTSKSKQASKDQKTVYKVEHTPGSFSRNSSLSSLSIHSDDDDDPDDLALLEDCLSAGLPPPTRPSRNDRRRSSHGHKTENSLGHRKVKGSDSDMSSNSRHRSGHSSATRNYSSADELESSGTHDSRYTSWRQQPHKSCDEIFKKPTLDAKGRPCRRSRSQDSEKKMLKQYKDSSNKELAQQYVINVGNYVPGRYYDSLPRDMSKNENMEELERQRQQIISESQNLTRSIEHQVREIEYQTQGINLHGEKSDEHENEKNDTPTSEQNFFMTCSGMTEISVESISKTSIPSNMVPYDTDDDILDSSLSRSRFSGDGGDSQMMISSHERTLTGVQSVNTTLTEHTQRMPMDLSITSEDEKALAENANIVMSEMALSRMVMSGSTVEDDRFIEHETLSLVSNEYISDTASEASITWSLSSDRTSECTESLASTECGSPQMRRPRIVKPEDKFDNKMMTESEVKAVRGKRKPLYHSRSVPTAAVSPMGKDGGQIKGRIPVNSAKLSPRSVQGAANNTSNTTKKTHTLRTLPQACSTPVKSNPNQTPRTRPNKPSQPQRSSSLDQKPQNVKKEAAQRIANHSGYMTPTKIPAKSNSPRSKSEGGETKPKTLSKQGTFIKESTTRNIPVISPDEKTNQNVKLRQKKDSGSSIGNRNSIDSGKSINSNNVSHESDDSPQEHSLSTTQETMETSPKKKDSKLRRSIGTSQLSNSKKNLHSPGSKIPSPSRNVQNKSGNSGNGKKTPSKPAPLLKTNSGSSLVKNSSGSTSGSNSSLRKVDSQQDVKKSSSNTSLRNNSRPSTPVTNKDNVTSQKITENNKRRK